MSGKNDDPLAFWGSVLTSRLSDVALLHPPFATGTQDDRCQALLDEIAAMSLALARLKERHNSAYCRLKIPIEVLEQIFAFVAMNEIPGQTNREEHFRPDRGFDTNNCGGILGAERRTYEILGWVKITHVCRAWRAIALADRNRWLWTTLDTGRLSETGIMVITERSHPLPITLITTLRPRRRTTNCHFSPCLPRLKSARIICDEHNGHSRLTRMLNTTAVAQGVFFMLVRYSSPILESIAIEYDEADDHVLVLQMHASIPSLRHLKLTNVHFGSITTCPQLTHLEITTSSQEDFMLTSIDKFILFLQGCLNLQALRLTRTTPWMTSTAPITEEQHVGLGRLTELYLKGSIEDCARMGRFLDIPESCSIAIEAPACKASFPHEILGPMLRRWIPSPVRLDIYSGDDEFLNGIKAWHADAGGIHDSPPRLHLARLPWRRQELLHLMAKQFSPWETLYDSVSLEHLVDFRVHARSKRPKTLVSWPRLLRRATAARHVRVEGRDAIDDLISLLSSVSPSTQQPHQQDDKPLYPGLQSLSIRSFDHVALVEKHELQDCLQARKDAGVGDAMIDVQFEFPDGMVPPGFEASLAELDGLATFQIKPYN